jgi:hypothetical protein
VLDLVEAFGGIKNELIDFTLTAATLAAKSWTANQQEKNHTDIGNEEDCEQPSQC